MPEARFHFYDRLGDFVPPRRKAQTFIHRFEPDQSVKHLVESLGAPHPEVGRLRANGLRIEFNYLPKDGDLIEIYPSQVIGGGILGGDELRPPVERRFIIDNHLGRLASYLRMLGFDSLYRNDYQDEELAAVSQQENRILLSRDQHLLMRNAITYGYWVRSKTPSNQIVEVARIFQLAPESKLFTRCMRCNGLLQLVDKTAVIDRLLPLTRRYYEDFKICPDCGQIYWRGSHYDRMQALIEEVKKTDSTSGA